MKTKIYLVAVVVVLAGLLGQAQWRVRKLQRTLDFQTATIRSMAAAHAYEDVSRNSASYFLLGLLMRDYVAAFASHFKEYGIHPVATGCKVFEAQHLYSDEYNRVVRDSLVKRYGKDLIQEFDTSYSINQAR